MHGSAPDIAGQGKANPLAMVLSLAMMLRYSFDLGDEADLLERSVTTALDNGLRTADLVQADTQQVSTGGMGDAILSSLDELGG